MIHGIWGHPYLELSRYIDGLSARLGEIDDEICMALSQLPTEYTGGSHRTLDIVPPSMRDEEYVDYGEVIAGFDRREFARFIALSDTPGEFDLTRYKEYSFGEEQDYSLSRKQMNYLKYRHGVYFPWQVFYEMIPTENWADKSRGAGKRFNAEALRYFPKTIELVRSLPFAEIGRCNILGLDANHHGTVHHDGDSDDPEAEHFITLCPRGNKRLFLWDEDRQEKVFVKGRAYWFNDHDYHGVAPDPFFRYALRVDGVFTDAFLAQLRRDHPRRAPGPKIPAAKPILELPPSTLAQKGPAVCSELPGRLGLKFSRVLSPEECLSLLRGIYAGRAEWTANFEGIQFTLGRAYYTHLEQDREDEYFARAAESNATIRRLVPGLQERMQSLVQMLVQAKVVPRPDWCGAGVHIFPADGHCALHGGDLHFDVEGLRDDELARGAPALTLVLMLQPAQFGGGLRVWNSLYSGAAIVKPEDAPAESELCSYATGDLVVIDSHRLHQIMPFGGSLDRVSVTLHAVYVAAEQHWEVWF